MKTLSCMVLAIVLCSTAFTAWAAEFPQVGDTLPPFVMSALILDEDAAALGLDPNREFTLADIATPYVMIEIIGVYCKVCHEQLSTLTKLYKRLRKTHLDERVTMLGIAAGATPMEVEFIRQNDYVFPMVHDTEFEIYNAFGDTKTPFTMIVDKEGKVLYAQQGAITDLKAFLNELESLVE